MTDWLLRVRRPLAAALLVLLGLSIHGLRFLEFDLSLVPLLAPNEQERDQVRQFRKALPPRPIHHVCVLDWGHPVGARELDELASLTRALEEREDVLLVLSLANLQVVGRDGHPASFVSTIGERSVFDAAREHPLIYRTFISKDGQALAVLIGARHTNGIEMLERLERFAPSRTTADVRFVGGEPVQRAMTTAMKRDMLQSVSLEALLFALLLPLVFKTFRGVLLPLFCVLAAAIYGLGLFALLGFRISLIDVSIPGLVIIIGLCDAVHLLHRFEEELLAGKSRDDAIRAMLRTAGRACLYTSVTTAIGFASLMVAEHDAVFAFGIKAALAVMVTYVTVILGFPVCLALWPVRHGVKDRLTFFRRFRPGPPVPAFLLGVLALAFSVFGVSKTRVDSRWLEEMPANEPAVQAVRWYEENFQGLLTIDAEVRGDLLDLERFRAIEQVQEAMSREAGITQVESYTVWVREVLGLPKEVDADALERARVRLALVPGLFPRHVVTPEWDRARLVFRTSDLGTRRFLEHRERLESLGREHGIEMQVTGFMLMAHQSSRLVITTLLSSFLVSLAVITLLISLIFRSWRLGLLSILPNALPVLFGLGLAGFLDIPLRIGIAMIFCLGLGLAVDDTLHLFTRFVQERRHHPGLSVAQAVQASLRTAGRAMVSTSLFLALGCLCYLPASFQSLQDVGILLTAIIVVAVIADLFLLPHLMTFFLKERDRHLPV